MLCVDAIIDSADTNSDWRLDFEEYKTLMDSSFQPKEKRELFCRRVWKSGFLSLFSISI